MRLKQGVRLLGVRPEIVAAMNVAESIYQGRGEELVVTSCVDGTHSRGSKHYSGAAFDGRTRNLPNDAVKQDVANQIQQALGDEFDVVLEDTHLHVEWDAKGPING